MKKPEPGNYGLSNTAVAEAERSIDSLDSRLIPAGLVLGYAGAVIVYWETFGFLGFFFSIVPAFVGGALGTALASLVNRLRFSSYYRYKTAREAYEKWFVRTQTEFWTQLSGLAFEREVAALLIRLGHKATLTPASGDKGVDIVVDGETIVQCKAYKERVGPAAARELYGTLKDFKVGKAVLVSKVGFTSGVYEFVKGKPITLWDIRTLIEMQRRCAAQRE